MTQAPERQRLVAPGVTRRTPTPPRSPVQRPVQRPPQRPGFDKAAWNKAVLLLNVALLGGVAIIGLNYIRTAERPDLTTAGEPSGVVSTLAEPDATPQTIPGTTSSEPTAPTTAAPVPASGGVAQPPRVQPRMRSSFAKGDGWPVGAGFREAGRLAWPLGVVDRLMTHGPAQGPDAVSWLEKWMKTDVRTIGARVLFAPNHSGAAVITAWHTSILDTSGQQLPRTGMRLVVTPGGWRLVAIDSRGSAELASGSYVRDGRSAAFDMVRRDQTVWITDPNGTVTSVTDPRVGALSGPWASWELREDKVGKRPAGFQEIWAG